MISRELGQHLAWYEATRRHEDRDPVFYYQENQQLFDKLGKVGMLYHDLLPDEFGYCLVCAACGCEGDSIASAIFWDDRQYWEGMARSAQSFLEVH